MATQLVNYNYIANVLKKIFSPTLKFKHASLAFGGKRTTTHSLPLFSISFAAIYHKHTHTYTLHTAERPNSKRKKGREMSSNKHREIMKEQDHQERAGSKSKAKMVVEEAFFSDDDDDDDYDDEILDVDDEEEDDNNNNNNNTFYIHKPILEKGTDNSYSNSISARTNNNDSELERDLNLAIMNSLLEINSANSSGISLLPRQTENLDGDEINEVIRFKFNPKTTNPLGKRKWWTSSPAPPPSSSNSLMNGIETVGDHESWNSSIPIEDDPSNLFDCEICIETKSASEFFRVKGCKHGYCSKCVGKYVASRLEENVTNIGCPVPDCQGFLDPDHCRSIIPPMVFGRWGLALCEAAIPEEDKFYCPYRECSALMIHDGKKIVGQWECPHCKRMFCVQCKVPWHDSITCEDFQRNNVHELAKEDGMLIELAETKNWRRCPSCNYFVEKVRGCTYVKCRSVNLTCNFFQYMY